jgi:hypothetical protein
LIVARQMVEIISDTAVCNHPGRRVPIRYVLVRDPQGELEPVRWWLSRRKKLRRPHSHR